MKQLKIHCTRFSFGYCNLENVNEFVLICATRSMFSITKKKNVTWRKLIYTIIRLTKTITLTLLV